MTRKITLCVAMLTMTSAVFAGDIVLDMRVDGFNNLFLTPGNSYDAVISLAAPSGSISSVRLMQLDDRFTFGATLNGYTWNIGDGTINDSLYFKEIYSDIPTVVRANYVGFNPIPGFILDLTTTPIEIGRYNFTFNGPTGAINVVGAPNDDAHRDEGLYFQTGFSSGVETYFIGKGNILPGGQSDAPGNLPLAVPEPTSLGLLALGVIAALRRRK